MSTAPAAAAAVAAEAARLMMQEEEEMTPYSDRDLAEGWEFKIVRSPWGAFRKPEQLRALLEEEKQGGWILVEKFDDSRIRLKRLVGAKRAERDLAEGYDAYRTTVGLAGEKRFLVILIAAGAGLLTLILVAIIATH